MASKRPVLKILGVFVLLAAVIGGTLAYRVTRLYRVAVDWRSDLRYLIEDGGTIGETAAAHAFDEGYLAAVFGDDPDLLAKLSGVIATGLAEDPAVILGEVAAMVVTYRKNNNDNRVRDVAAHIIGGFPLGQRRLGFHRDGFFMHQIDRNLWGAGNSAIAFLGRDILLFAEEDAASRQRELLESVLTGNILPLANSIAEGALFYTAVFPDPRRVVPPQLRPHVQAFIVRGSISATGGENEVILLTPRQESARYALGMVSDMKLAARVALQSRFAGVEIEQPWGRQILTWWSYAMANTLIASSIEKELNIVRMRSSYERVMVNAILKSIARLGRDLSQMRGSLDEKLDPRLVDARLRSGRPLHYWSDQHQWGPDWPIPAPPIDVFDAEAPAEEGDATPTAPIDPATQANAATPAAAVIAQAP